LRELFKKREKRKWEEKTGKEKRENGKREEENRKREIRCLSGVEGGGPKR
jgi:hypothetical protein